MNSDKSGLVINRVINYKKWHKISGKLQKRLYKLFGEKDYIIGLRLVDDAEIANINKEYRFIYAPTNVLALKGYVSLGSYTYLGDIVLAYDYIVAEAKEMKLSSLDRATWALIHGILHLLGYDHLLKADRITMENLENQLMQSLEIL